MVESVGFGCQQAGPYSVTFLTPVHRGIGLGGFQRSCPTGGNANGMPLKTRRSPSVFPSTVPAGAFTIGPLFSSDAGMEAEPSALHKSIGVRKAATAAQTSGRRQEIIRWFLQLCGFRFQARAPTP